MRGQIYSSWSSDPDELKNHDESVVVSEEVTDDRQRAMRL
jgi:hypothetical protein